MVDLAALMARTDRTEFTLTEDHLKLLRRSYVNEELSDVEFGAAEIDPKRPYGNSGVVEDILEILGWDPPRHEEAQRLHGETPLALQIVLCTGSFTTGTYRRDKPWQARGWKLINDPA